MTNNINELLIPLQNFKVTFEVSDPDSTTTDAWGNMIPSVGDVELFAACKEDKLETSFELGKDPKRLILFGFLTTPLEFPPSVFLGQKGEARYKQRENESLVGEFTLKSKVMNPASFLETGSTKFKGVLVVQGTVQEPYNA